MGTQAFSSANSRMDDETAVRAALAQATNALTALQAVGIPSTTLSPVEIAFLNALNWTDLKDAIIAAYDQQTKPFLQPAAGLPNVAGPNTQGVITLYGTLPAQGN